MAKGKTQIPLCRSEFLQDVTIALGRRSLKGLRYLKRTLEFIVRDDEVNGVIHERLDIEARTLSDGTMTKITLWENATAWVYSADRSSKASRAEAFEMHASLAGMNEEDVAELLRATMRDVKSIQHIWQKHAISSR